MTPIRLTRLTRLASLALWLPALFLLWLISGSYVENPMFDQWWLVPFFEKMASGSAGLADLFAYQNRVHVNALPRAIFTALAFASDWRMQLEVLASLGVVALCFRALRVLGSRGSGEPRLRGDFVAPGLISLLVFSAVQHWNWLWGFALTVFLINGAMILGALLLREAAAGSPQRKLALAALCCVAATLTRVDGLLCWIALLPSVWLASAHSARRLALRAVWLGLAVLCTTAVVWGMPEGAAPDRSLASYATTAPRLGAHALALLGVPLGAFAHPLFPGISVIALWVPIGAALLLAYAALAARAWRSLGEGGEWERAAPWLSIGAFSILYAGLNAVGRSDADGNLAAVSSMYSTPATLLSVAVVQLAARPPDSGWGRRLRIPAAVAVGACLLANQAVYVPGLLARRSESWDDQLCAELVLYLDRDNRCPQLRRRGMLALEKLGFREIRRGMTFVEHPGERWGGTISAPGPTGRLRGWVRAAVRGEPPAGVVFSRGETHRLVGGTLGFAPDPARSAAGEARLAWSFATAGAPGDADARGLRAWLYDPARRRFLRLHPGPESSLNRARRSDSENPADDP